MCADRIFLKYYNKVHQNPSTFNGNSPQKCSLVCKMCDRIRKSITVGQHQLYYTLHHSVLRKSSTLLTQFLPATLTLTGYISGSIVPNLQIYTCSETLKFQLIKETSGGDFFYMVFHFMEYMLGDQNIKNGWMVTNVQE